jgi:hypothetical protein
MPWLKAIFRELFGLFVDDDSFALTIIVWLGIGRWVLPRLAMTTACAGVILFAGLAVILSENTWRRARNSSAGR